MKVFNFLLIIFLFCGTTAHSQFASGNRGSTDGSPLNFRPSAYIWHKQYPILKSCLPLDTGMPTDILLSYIYLDSALKNVKNSEFETRLDTWTTNNDTLETMYKYFYKMVDYDPVKFHQYARVSAYHSKCENKGSGSQWVVNLASKYLSLHKADSSQRAIFSMLGAENILHIKITNIESKYPPHRSWGDSTEQFYKAECTVLDTLKGQVFQSYLVPMPQAKNSKSTPEATYYTYFEYQKKRQWQHNWNVKRLYPLQEPRMTTADGYDFKMDEGKEYIVFLKRVSFLVDEENDYFRLSLSKSFSNNALPIENGYVYDVNHIWSDQDSLTMTEWKSIYESYKQQIIGN